MAAFASPADADPALGIEETGRIRPTGPTFGDPQVTTDGVVVARASADYADEEESYC